MKWHIGCSGFYYKHWKKLFYPEDLPQSKWFEYYCTQFNTLELNVTFYRFPQLSFLENWYQKSPANFKFSVKAPRTITHYKQFHQTDDLISDFYNILSKGLQEKLGCILFQLPPRMDFSQERLQRIIQSLDSSFHNVIEFRHQSWWKEEVYQELGKHQITFCGISHPQLPADIIQNSPILYYRFHGAEQLYRSEYPKEAIKLVTDNIKASARIKQAFIYFNNDIGGSAIINAKQMQQMV